MALLANRGLATRGPASRGPVRQRVASSEHFTGWEWFWVILAALFDLAHLAATIARRRELMQSAQRA